MGTIWFFIVAGMLAAYVVLDGFDIGAGIIQPFIARSDSDKQAILRTIGPVWDGNEVWLIAGGGTLYFAFPLLYASAFSGFYLPLMVVLWLLILRGIGIELRMHIDLRVWREFFDGCFVFASMLLAVFFGAALANVIRGVPLGADGYFFLPFWTNWNVGPHPGILDWYTVIGGLVAVAALAVHGALYVAVKTEDALQRRAAGLAKHVWFALLLLTLVSLIATVVVRPTMLSNYTHYPVALLIPAVVAVSLAGILYFSHVTQYRKAFASSCVYLVFMLLGAAIGLYPTMLPSSSDPSRGITIAKALAGPYALSIGLIWWTIGIIGAIGYFIFMYRMFRGKVTMVAGDEH